MFCFPVIESLSKQEERQAICQVSFTISYTSINLQNWRGRHWNSKLSSIINPKYCTLVSRETNWNKIFKYKFYRIGVDITPLQCYMHVMEVDLYNKMYTPPARADSSVNDKMSPIAIHKGEADLWKQIHKNLWGCRIFETVLTPITTSGILALLGSLSHAVNLR